MPKITEKLKHILSALKWHVWVNLSEGNFIQTWRFIKANLQRKLFGYPYVALIETGNYCNLRCPTCPTAGQQNQPEKRIDGFWKLQESD